MKKRNFRREKKGVWERSIFCNVAPFQNMKGNAKKERSAPSKYKDFKQIEIMICCIIWFNEKKLSVATFLI